MPQEAIRFSRILISNFSLNTYKIFCPSLREPIQEFQHETVALQEWGIVRRENAASVVDVLIRLDL